MNKQQFGAMSLPHKLKAIFTDKYGVVRIHEIDHYLYQYICDSEKDNSLYKYKYILRPLSDLTKPIEHKGEKFVPIVELAKLANVETIGRAEFSKQTEYQTNFYVDYINKRVRKRFQLRRLTFEKESFKLDFGYFYPYRNGFLYVDNQFILFTKLIEWHFDIAGLIEKGEAIDVNTLPENPYK